MGVQFFANWELWEQLTFVLAAGIVVVFIIGWIKLWWSQRLLKKYAILDEEKRVRQMEMRKSGLPVGKRVDIPFGVRAIQSGVEVEGIWISRPATPVEARSASKASSVTPDGEGELRPGDKGKAVMGSVAKPTITTTVAEAESSSKPSSSRAGGDVDQRTLMSGAASPGPYLQSHSPQYLGKDNHYVPRYLNATPQPEDMVTRPPVETYIPTSSGSSLDSSQSPRVRPAADRTSISSEEGFNSSNPRYPPEVRGRPAGFSPHNRGPVDDVSSSPSARPSTSRSKYSSRLRAEMRGSPYESYEADGSSSADHAPATRLPLASRPVPVRTYTDQRETTMPRVVNAGFEVLPAGTLGRPSGEHVSFANDGSPGVAR